MVKQVDVQDAAKLLSELLERVALGDEIVIARSGEPVAKLVPFALRRKRKPGGADGLVVPDALFEPLPDDLGGHFE